ncbi:MAG: amino acid permease, partial [Sediminibacterium sp.]|nr:amino acid permease [Sediminibacterium sp.]
MLLKIFRKKSLELASMDNTDTHSSSGLKKELGVKDLTFMGVAAVIGAGVFSTIGKAAFEGGPGIAFLFLITAITCGFSALCYAEFASRIPIAGSAYTYSYIAFGEVIAWIIGWALILEYAVGNIVVAISWSSYLNNLLLGFNIHLPDWLCHNIFDSRRHYVEAIEQINKGISIHKLPVHIKNVYNAYLTAPTLAGLKIILNLPAFIIVAFICSLTYIGIKESKKSANFMVIFKIIVILFIIILGFFYITPSNWTPFLPNGIGGVMAGVSAVFYAYIGFDAISTTAEECKNPKKDLPRGMFYSLIICTILYILISLVLTGMVHYSELNVEDPLAFVFNKLNLNKIGYIISISAVVATTSVLLVFQIGQPRIWMSMSRDGLLPKKFAAIHPKYRTPYFATIISGLFVGVPALFATSSSMTELTSIGTL